MKKIIWVTGVLRRTLVCDWRFDNLCGSHFQSHLHFTLKMASAQIVETSVTNNNPSQDSNHQGDLFQSSRLTNYHSITNHLKSCLYLLYSGREEPAKQISQKYTLEVSQQQKRWLDKLIEVNFFQPCDGEISNKSFTLTLKRKPVWNKFSVYNQCVHSPVYVKNSKRIDKWKIRGNCIKLFPRYWAIFICVIYLENSL